MTTPLAHIRIKPGMEDNWMAIIAGAAMKTAQGHFLLDVQAWWSTRK